MAKFQSLSFSTVGEFLDYLPENELQIVEALRDLVLEAIPECREKLSYNVPYYYRFARICFIWPSAVPWGKVARSGVMFGFCAGHLLHDEINYLEKGSRKQVYTKTYLDRQEIAVDLLRAYIFEAVEIDAKIWYGKRK